MVGYPLVIQHQTNSFDVAKKENVLNKFWISTLNILTDSVSGFQISLINSFVCDAIGLSFVSAGTNKKLV